MPIPENDERFEGYLKEFRPIAPHPLRIVHMAPRRLRIGAWAGSLAAVAAAVVFMIRPHTVPSSVAEPQILTIRRANALLAHAPSFQSAVDVLAFQSPPAQWSNGMYSALTVLSKEKQ